MNYVPLIFRTPSLNVRGSAVALWSSDVIAKSSNLKQKIFFT
jgi:hypothetical protein